ncbi:checkpoint clamp complex protein Rad1 [Coemansia sp. RSA 353]|nr:checkpoint clamp complex protein Rad1 [Coemansia sp. RSA 1591]KAJ1763787.1 checkpoint clamp complex protein Rad1 [Coemansia sp. RSA 1752]KAJ2132521.1 checkpoint clamp complex protein Rad1 [Coemansia sp. RSA 921]KAJ2138460.1 checkpoint clamp complex protein Rad1 [Coemansia sp. RSA 788]KAJ2142420.1 checkpoint clamp complex protein Rad1 [Coemansia sp. RSA 564]KAJ2152418.1 checkpoint clamp complex protein Rad1 [Coemansia sp. RSA 637]KAJ2164195.1 checkpoint clamp complex protein Rad1 [Coemansia
MPIINKFSADTTAANVDPASVLFKARATNIRPLVNMLRSIFFRNRVSCAINSGGIVFTVEEASSTVAQAYVRTELFATFSYNVQLAHEQNRGRTDSQNEEGEETVHVVLPLDVLLDCLMLFYGPASTAAGVTTGALTGSSGDLRGATTAHIAFNGLGTDFELMLEERGIISVCRMATFEPEPTTDLDFASSPVTQQLIIRSEWLRDAFNELDPTSETVGISMSPSRPYFRISTTGDTGSTEMTYSKDEHLDSFFCSEEHENWYKLAQIQRCKHALSLSDKTKIRVNQRGFVSFQFMIPTDADVSFVNFLFAPQSVPDEL